MPKKNAIREYGAGEYYHVYNRGAGKEAIFRHDDDYRYMLGLFKKYLSENGAVDKYGRTLPNYHNKIELVAYCLMQNHYHLFVYLLEDDGLEKMMRSVMTAYSRYFNQKYQRSGTLFETQFLASRVSQEPYFLHITRYIHLNPMDIQGVAYANYPYSSIQYFLDNKHAEWLHPERVMDINPREVKYYKAFLESYQDRHEELKQLKHLLADQ